MFVENVPNNNDFQSVRISNVQVNDMQYWSSIPILEILEIPLCGALASST